MLAPHLPLRVIYFSSIPDKNRSPWIGAVPQLAKPAQARPDVARSG